MDEDERDVSRATFTARSAASYSYVVTRDGEGIVAFCAELDARGEAATVADAVGAMRAAIAKRLRAV